MVIIACQYKFPEGDAGSVRYYGFAKMIKECLKRDVRLIGYGPITNGWQDFHGIPYISVRESHRFLSFVRFAPKLLREIKQIGNVSAIIVGNVDNFTFLRLKLFCKRRKIRLVDDVVEWYAPEQFNKGKFDYRYIAKNNENTRLVDRNLSVIAISSFLYNYFTLKGIETVRIPNFMHQADYPVKSRVLSDRLVLTYTGTIGKKDGLNMIIEGISLLDENERSKIELNVLGATIEQVEFALGNDIIYQKVKNVIIAKGRVPRSEVLSTLLHSDFTVVMRSESERNTMAGFPTKVVESISTGTPVIMNFTSDLSLYFRDNVDCIQVKGYSSSNFAEALKRALALSHSEIEEMSTNAKLLAVKHFDTDSYVNEMKTILGI